MLNLTIIQNWSEIIISEAQEHARESGITQGAIVVRYKILDEELMKEPGFSEHCPDLVYTAPLAEGSKDTFYRVDGKPEGDCAAVADMKIASARRMFLAAYERYNRSFPTSLTDYKSGNLPGDLLGNGRTPWKGGIYIPVGSPERREGKIVWGFDVIDIGLAVSGGTQNQDDAIIDALLPTIRRMVCGKFLLIPEAFPQ